MSDEYLPEMPNIELGQNEVFTSMLQFQQFKMNSVFGANTSFGPMEPIPRSLGYWGAVDPTLLNETQKKVLSRELYLRNPLVAQAIDLKTTVPLSKIKLSPPLIDNDPELQDYILNLYRYMVDKTKLFQNMMGILHELNLNGYVYIWVELDEETKMWNSITLLADETEARHEINAMTGETEIFMKVAHIDQYLDELYENGDIDRDSYEEAKERGEIRLPTNPYEGSFCTYLERKPSSLYSRGVSSVDRNHHYLMIREFMLGAIEAHSRRSSRNLELFMIPDGTDDYVNDFEYNFWVSLWGHDTPIVTNYNVDYQLISGQDKKFDYLSELEYLDDAILSGFGLSKGILQGEGTWGGERIPMEIINTQFYLDREMMKDFVHEYLFKPMAYFHGFYVPSIKISEKYLQSRLYKAVMGDPKDSAKRVNTIDTGNPEKIKLDPDEVGQSNTPAKRVDTINILGRDYKDPSDRIKVVHNINSSSLGDVLQKSDENSFLSSQTAFKESRDYNKQSLERYKLIKSKLDESNTIFNSRDDNINRFVEQQDAALNYFNNSKSNKDPYVGYGHKTYNFKTSGSDLGDKNIDPNDPWIVWYFPNLSFKRVAITDSDEAFAQLYNLYVKGSIPLNILLDTYNIETESVEAQLKEDYASMKDPLETVIRESMFSNVGSFLAENPKIQKFILEKMGLDNFPKDAIPDPDAVAGDSDMTGGGSVGGIGGGMDTGMGDIGIEGDENNDTSTSEGGDFIE